MFSYRAFSLAVAVTLVCFAAVAQASTVNILTNSACVQADDVRTFTSGTYTGVYWNTDPVNGNGAADGRPDCIELSGNGTTDTYIPP